MKKYTEKQLNLMMKESYNQGIDKGRQLQIDEDSRNKQSLKIQAIDSRYESVNRLLSVAGQYQETITKLVMAAERQM